MNDMDNVQGDFWTSADILYPEHVKLNRIADVSQLCGEFLDWIKTHWTLCDYDEKSEKFYPSHQSTIDLLAKFFGIDLDKIEAEKRAMLESLRHDR